MDYTLAEAVTYIEKTPKFTKKHSVGHTRACLGLLGHPEEDFAVIHVAGTNGKGSVCAFLDEIFRCAGYRCALFSSPHLVDLRERFRIDGKMAGEEAFLEAFSAVCSLSQRLEKEGTGHPSYFEFLFLMAMRMFSRAGTELTIVETGMGGGRDATSAVSRPRLCAVTSISRDHEEYLGDSLEAIAREKAGILVPGVPAVYAADEPAAKKVIEERAAFLGCPAYPVYGRDLAPFPEGEGIGFTHGGKAYHLETPALYQAENALLALRCAEVLMGAFPVSGEDVSEGLRRMRWPGRMERVLPDVLADGAHNEDGIRRFAQSALPLSKGRPAALLFAASREKNAGKMLRTLLELQPGLVVLTEAGGERSFPCGELATLIPEGAAGRVLCEADPRAAFALARREKGEDALLFCTGSLYLVGVVEELAGGMRYD